MKMRAFVLLLATTTSVGAAAPKPTDFAYGIRLQTEPDFAIYDLVLPDQVYRGVTRTDLGDLRVFNANGGVVPHAFCGNVGKTSSASAAHDLPVFPLPPGTTPEQVLEQVSISTPAGTAIEITTPGDAVESRPPATEFLLDARAVENPIHSVKLAWRSTGQHAEVDVRIEASHDLDDWDTVVDRSTLLRVEANGATVERSQLTLPEARYRFLRVSALEPDSGLLLDGAQVGSIKRTTTDAPMTFFPLDVETKAGNRPQLREYGTQSRAPVTRARLELPQPNMALKIRLSSRDNTQFAWEHRGESDVQSLNGQTSEMALSPAARHQFWRIEVLAGAESLGNQPLHLELGYVPPRLRFLGQGAPPFLLAYGSRRAGPASLMECHALQGNAAAAIPVSEAQAEAAHIVGAQGALTPPAPPPKPTPLRLYALWAVLGGGVLFVVLLAMRLLKKLRVENP